MKKFFYYFGVYSFCVVTHIIITNRSTIMQQCKELERNVKEIKKIVAQELKVKEEQKRLN